MEPTLEDRRQQMPLVMLVLGCIAAIEADDQRDLEAASDRQRQRPAAPEMRVDETRPHCPQIRDRRQDAEMLENLAVERAQHALAAEKHRLGREIGQSVAAPAPEPYRVEALETDIKATEKTCLRARHQMIAVREDCHSVSIIRAAPAGHGSHPRVSTTQSGSPLRLYTPRPVLTSPVRAYGKLAREKYLALYEHLHGLDYRVLRVTNPFEPFQIALKSQGVVRAASGSSISAAARYEACARSSQRSSACSSRR